MALEDYRDDMESCCRCSICKFIPLEKIKSAKDVNICPSISKYNFHAYSGGGRMAFGTAMLEKRIDFSAKLLEVVYNCQTCGACDISCKYAMDMEVLEPIYEMRARCVENGHTLPALDKLIGKLRSGPKPGKGEWAKGLNLIDINKQQAEVIYHVGCKPSDNQNMWKANKINVSLLQKAGVDIGIAGEKEVCCGGRAYQMGYQQDSLKQAKLNMELFKKAGAKTLVTGCADCYHAFKVLYDKFGLKGELEVLHVTDYLTRLIKEGKLKPSKQSDMKVTYHDPCHLGRLGEPFIHWEGKLIPGHIRLFDPPKEFRRGTYGIYEPPRDVLKSIPGITLVEMERIKEYSWCCGAGGGVKESNPEFALWTANERIAEAEATGAEAMVTTCPHCIDSFKEAIKKNGSTLKVYDVVELLENAI